MSRKQETKRGVKRRNEETKRAENEEERGDTERGE